MSTYESHFPKTITSPEDMVSFGKIIGSLLKKGDVLALIGNLGAGKTHLTQGIAQFFNYDDQVTSPTFGLIHEYSNTPLVHSDLYRMEHPSELLQIGWEDYLERELILIVEWADKFPELMPEGTHWIKIEHEKTHRNLQYTLH